MPLPYQGSPSDNYNNYLDGPTLIPQFYPNYVSSDPSTRATVMTAKSPAKALRDNPRGLATATITLGGSTTSGDNITVTLTHPQLPSGAISATAAIGGTTTLAQAAADITRQFTREFAFLTNVQPSGISDNPFTSAPVMITMHPTTNVMTMIWVGPMGNFAVLSGSVSGAATETITFSPVGGALGGGSGPVFIANNFNFSYNGVTMSFYYGQLKFLDADLLAVLAAQDMPVI